MTPYEILQTIEIELLENIARTLAKGNIGTAEWQIKKLGDMGRLDFENQAIIKKHIKGLDAAITKDISDELAKYSGQLDIMFQTALNSGAELSTFLPPNASQRIRDIISAAERSQSSLPNLLANSMLSGANEVYSNTINLATTKALASISTGNQALTETLRSWAEEGLPGLVDSAGRTWQPESYARMEMTTAKTNARTELCLERSEQYGNDLIEVDSHLGARPRCAAFQGRVYSRSGTDSDYTALADTSYGEAAGLFGVNCGHHMYPFFKGVSKQTYNQYNETENAEAYKDRQRQRLLERKIRAAKRQVSTLEAGGLDAADAKRLVKERQSLMRDFINQTKRTRQYDREQIIS